MDMVNPSKSSQYVFVLEQSYYRKSTKYHLFQVVSCVWIHDARNDPTITKYVYQASNPQRDKHVLTQKFQPVTLR